MMKSLLILGGQLKHCDIVRAAQSMGLRTVVTDWYEDSPAKLIADKAYNISTSDVEGILGLINDEHIDGVFTGFIDSTLPYYVEICRRAGLPCYLNEKTLECCTNKLRFKELCRRTGIEPVPEVDLRKKKSISYPIVVKPADNSGSKGITVCSSEDMIQPAYERALKFSRSKSAVVEQFLNCDYLVAYYTVSNGESAVSLLMDKDMNRIGRGVVPYPTAFVAPSRYEDSYMEHEHPKVLEMIKELGFDNGTFLISFFVNGGRYYAVELTARLTATREYIFIKDKTGADNLKKHINYAMGGQFDSPMEYKKGEKSIYCMLFISLKEGIIGKIEGMESVGTLPGVLNVLQLRTIGSTVRADGSYGQLFARIYLKSSTMEEMAVKVKLVQETLRVYSEEGQPMVLAGFDAGSFFRCS